MISHNPSDVDDLLAPYNEDVGKGDEYAEFTSTEAEDRREYETGGVESFIGRDMGDVGEEPYIQLQKERFIHLEEYKTNTWWSNDREPADEVVGQFSYWKKDGGWQDRLYGVLRHVKKVTKEENDKKVDTFTFDVFLIPPPQKVPFQTIHRTFEEFEKDWRGYQERDEDTGEYGYWGNKNARWDWYQIGGRWAGRLVAKIGKVGNKGQPSLLMKEFEYKQKSYDQLQYKDIDTEAMVAKDRQELATNWNKSWEEAEEQTKEFYDTGKIDTKEFLSREEYLRNWVKLRLEDVKPGMTKEQYVELQSKEHPLLTHAIITPDGQWFEKGKMGWWAIVFDEDKEKYEKEFEQILTTINPNDWITLVDCHI